MVGIFAVAKFTEGAWLVVVVFPVLVFLLMRLNREYRAEAAILEMFRTDRPDLVKYARHRVFVFVNSVDLAVIEALRYGRGLRADELIAVHFMVDAAYAAQLRNRWDHFELDTRLRVVDCPDRRITRAAQLFVAKARDENQDTNVTVLLPRRTYAPLIGRLLHDRTADKIARAVSLIPDAAATIVPYDVQTRIQEAYPDRFEQKITRELDKVETWVSRGEDQDVDAYEHPDPSRSVITVAGLIPGQRATFEGRVSEVEDTTKGRRTLRSIVVGDNSGEITVTFNSGRGGADIQPGQLLRITGKARQSGNRPMSMIDPAYHVVEDPAATGELGKENPGKPANRSVTVADQVLFRRRGHRESERAMKRLAAVLVSVLGLTFTANGYRPLTKHGYGSVFAFAYGVLASELPVQTLGVQLAALATVSRRLPARLRQFSWLVVGVVMAGIAGPAPHRAQGQRAADRGAGRRPGPRPPH